MPQPPQEQEPIPIPFDERLQNALTNAEVMGGEFIQRKENYQYGIYYLDRTRPSKDHMDADGPANPLRVIPSHYIKGSDGMAVQMRRAPGQLIAMRKGTILRSSLGLANLSPDDLGAVASHTLQLLPEFHAAQETAGVNYIGPIARQLLLRGLDQDPQDSERAFTTIAQACAAYQPAEGEHTKATIDAFANRMIQPLARIMSDEGKGIDELEHQGKATAVTWCHDPTGEHIVGNGLRAFAAFDEAGLVPDDFWRRFANVPLDSQSFGALGLLADKLNSPGADSVVEGMSASDRIRVMESAVFTALERAAAQPALDGEKVEQIRNVIIASKQRPSATALGSLVKLASIVIKNNYEDELTPLRPESSFADASPALALLLKTTLRPDADPADVSAANDEAAVFLRIITGIAEHGSRKQEQVVKTVGDVALRFADATPQELAALKEGMAARGLTVVHVEAMMRQQRRATRRDRDHRPGYGRIS